MMAAKRLSPLLFISHAILFFHMFLFGCSAKKVVFIPMPHASHCNSHIRLATELGRLGHQTWVLVPDVIVKQRPSETSDVVILPYGDVVEDLGELILTKSKVLDNFWAGKSQDVFVVHDISEKIWKNSMDVLSDSRFWTGIQNVRPDLVVLDWTPFCRTSLVVPYKLDIPFAFFGVHHDVVNARVPHSPACNPEIMNDNNDRMTITERILNTLLHVSFMTYNPFCQENIIQRFVSEKPQITLNSLSTKAEIFIAETDHILDYARPMLPNTKLVGGMAARPSKPLTGVFKTFMDESSNGAIVVTFGSSVSNLPNYISDKMLISFKQLNYNFVWRTNLTRLGTGHVLPSLWVPQNDLLGHKNTRMFISHCGANGQYEALYHGVPILCLPLFADQFHNARRVVNKGFGLRADIRHLTALQLSQLIKEVAENSTYKANIRRASSIFKELFTEPQKVAAFWLDHVLRFGGSYMRYAGQEMPLHEYLLFDVFSIFCGIIVLLTFIMTLILCMFYRCLFYFLNVRRQTNKING